MKSAQPSEFLTMLAEVAWHAGEILLSHYEKLDIVARTKNDNSPVTDADEETEEFILARLAHLAPGTTVIAEEEVAQGHIRAIGERFFLVDPLDGTKEFLNRNGEFTVNIAEIIRKRPVRGVVYAPVKNRLFMGEVPGQAFEIKTEYHVLPNFAAAKRISARLPDADGLVAVASRSHRDLQTDDYLKRFRVKEFVSAGSSLKFCLVAAGEADIYPRHGRTMEWDIAAGHAVLAAAGGSVTQLNGRAMVYGKSEESFANPYFVARGLT